MKISSKLTKTEIEKYNKELFKDNSSLKNLVDSINKQKLVVFWGAGVSSLAGCKNWDGLTRSLIKKLTNEKVFNYSEEKKLNEMCSRNLRKVITICMNRAEKIKKSDVYYESIQNSVNPKKLPEFNTIHKALLELEPLFYITTNIDEGIAELGNPNPDSKRIINLANEISLEKLKTDLNYQGNLENLIISQMKFKNIFYLHGSKSSIKTSIFSDSNYYEFYEKHYIKDFLEKLFSGEYTILFIGYSLSEQEILSNLFLSLKKHNRTGESELPIHYSLIPIYSSEISDLSLEEEYLEMYKIQPLFYFIDYDGFDALFSILNSLKQFIYSVKNPLQVMDAFSTIT